MMLTAIVSVLVGAILGGGVRAWEQERARRKEADALLSALVAEVEALTRLINHRGFWNGMVGIRDAAAAMIDAGRGEEAAPFMQIRLTRNYFTVYDSVVNKIGLLHPYFADRIVRFYAYAKAVLENYDPQSPFQGGATAKAVLEAVENDMQLLQTIGALGVHIVSFRPVAPPAGFVDLFADQPPDKGTLPNSQPPEAIEIGQTTEARQA